MSPASNAVAKSIPSSVSNENNNTAKCVKSDKNCSPPSEEQVRANYAQAGQSHAFTFFDSLDAAAKSAFLSQLASIDPVRVTGLFSRTMKPAATEANGNNLSSLETELARFAPPPAEICLRMGTPEFNEKSSSFFDTGLNAIKQGKVALLLLAGGQGTRLGSSAPKGCYDIGLPSQKSLFQLQAERFLRVQQMACTNNASKDATPSMKAPWYIMVSGPTRKDTEDFFKKNNYFGCDKSNITFFEQGTLPAFDVNGKFILESKDRLALAPDGNGGIYNALKTEGILADMERRGIEYVHAYCVDNCLVKVLDPIFMGYSIASECDCAAKTVPKTSPNESVGVVCLRDSKYNVVEYSEIPKQLSEMRENPSDASDTRLRFSCANIANHFYRRTFLENLCKSNVESQIQYHVANKKIPCVDIKTGDAIKPTTPNGVKLELFIFDVFPLCSKFRIYVSCRKEVFSPLKNKTGEDSAATSRRDIMLQSLRYLRQAGAIIDDEMLEAIEMQGEGSLDKNKVCEISPLVSYCGENLDSFKGKKLEFPIIISSIDKK